MINRLFLLVFFSLINVAAIAQSKHGNIWITGLYNPVIDFNSVPGSAKKLSSNFNRIFIGSHSTICDSSGQLSIVTNGAEVYNKNLEFIQNGERILYDTWYDSLNFYRGNSTSPSIILPKGDHQYYVFCLAANDSMIIADFVNATSDTPYNYNEIIYSVVDMDANNGQGAVVKKKIPIYRNDSIIGKVGLTACRAANGEDWWLTSQCKMQNRILSFYVTKDTILGPFEQLFEAPYWHKDMPHGQASFSKDGTKYAFVSWREQKIFLADFNRCTGKFSNPQTIIVPPTSTLPYMDSLTGIDYEYNTLGVCFSPNSRFVYLARYYSIYQIDLQDSDTSTQWQKVLGNDIIGVNNFAGYATVTLGPDNRIYIGNWNGVPYMSYIASPDLKGINCDVKPRAFKWNMGFVSVVQPPNNPNYALGKDSSGCWPLDIFPTPKNIDFSIFPNPTSGQININYKIANSDTAQLIITNLLGQELQNIKLVNSAQTLNTELNLPNYGLYLYKFIVNNKLMQAGKVQFVP